MIDGSEVPGFTRSFWLAYRDQCLPHISHYLSIREEEPLEGGLFVDQKTSQCCFLILQSVSNKIIHHAGVNRDRLTYTEQKYQPQHSVRGCCYDFSKLRQQCMNERYCTNDVNECLWRVELVSLLVSMAKVESTWKLEPGTQSWVISATGNRRMPPVGQETKALSWIHFDTLCRL